MAVSWRSLGAAMGTVLAVAGAVPVFSQDYGDTPYVQTPQAVVDKMLEIAKVNRNDFVIDLGSGDGRMVITAAKKYGARGFGVDLDKRLVTLSNRRAAQAGVVSRAKFYAQDLYETDLTPATIVTIYLLPEVNLMVRPKLLSTLKPGTRIVSHDYDMGDWPPDVSLVMDAPDKPVGRDHKSKVFYWVVPGQAAGKWRWQLKDGSGVHECELALNQNFQQIEGTLTMDGRSATIQSAKLTGDDVSFTAEFAVNGQPTRYEYTGHIFNHAIEGRATVQRSATGAPIPWNAARTEVWQPKHANAQPPVIAQ